MELNIVEQTEKLQAELANLQAQLQQIEQAKNNVVAAILKNAGKLELIQSLTPEEEPATVDKEE